MLALPRDILLYISNKLSLFDQDLLRWTCKRWKALLDSPDSERVQARRSVKRLHEDDLLWHARATFEERVVRMPMKPPVDPPCGQLLDFHAKAGRVRAERDKKLLPEQCGIEGCSQQSAVFCTTAVVVARCFEHRAEFYCPACGVWIGCNSCQFHRALRKPCHACGARICKYCACKVRFGGSSLKLCYRYLCDRCATPLFGAAGL